MPNPFDFGLDDYMFPTTQPGLAATGMILESANTPGKGHIGPLGVLENAVDEDARIRIRTNAMSAVLSWIAEGDYTYNSLDETIVVVADIDGDYEITEEEEEVYSNAWNEVPDALLSLGADEADVREFVDGPSEAADKAAARIGKALSQKMEEEEADDDSLIAGFAFGEDAILESTSYDDSLHGILEATYKRKKVVRDGKVQVVRKRVSGKVRLSAAQKAGLRKARRKAHTASANLARRKSMKIRQRRGM